VRGGESGDGKRAIGEWAVNQRVADVAGAGVLVLGCRLC
jgi:hypothetical protein